MAVSIIEHTIIHRSPDTFFRYHGWPSVAADEEGVLYAVDSGFRVSHVCPFGKTALYKSFDGGRTWSIPMVVNDTFLDDRDAGIVSLGGRKLLVTWFSHSADAYMNEYAQGIRSVWPGAAGVLDAYPTIPEGKGRGGSFIRISEDGGYTWGETVRIPISSPHGPTMKKDGTLVYLGKAMYADKDEEAPGTVAAYGSSDGCTWTRLGEVPIPEGLTPNHFHEPHAIELEDGRILGMIRAQGPGVFHEFTIYQTISEDGGRTWSVPQPLNVAGSPPHLLKHSSGAIVCVYGRREDPYSERAILSRDNGATWSDEYTIHPAARGDLGYPASAELPNGDLVTVYYERLEGDSFTSLLCTKWRIE